MRVNAAFSLLLRHARRMGSGCSVRRGPGPRGGRLAAPAALLPAVWLLEPGRGTTNSGSGRSGATSTSGPGGWRSVPSCDGSAVLSTRPGRGVPFARHRAAFSRDFEQLVAWLATRTDMSTIRRLVRIDWATVGRIIERVTADELDPDRLENLFEIGIDEVSWRKQHRYLTLVADHIHGQIVWGAEGRDAATAGRLYEEIGAARAHAVEVVSMDMGRGYAKATREHALQAIIAIDPFHVVALGNRALDDAAATTGTSCAKSDDLAAAETVQGRPLVAAQSTPEPDRQSSGHPVQAQTSRRWRVARLHAQRSTACNLRPRPHRRGRRRAARPLHLQGKPAAASDRSSGSRPRSVSTATESFTPSGSGSTKAAPRR
jgi:Transposase/Helix-turn-helix domain of transposase family ISL3